MAIGDTGRILLGPIQTMAAFPSNNLLFPSGRAAVEYFHLELMESTPDARPMLKDTQPLSERELRANSHVLPIAFQETLQRAPEPCVSMETKQQQQQQSIRKRVYSFCNCCFFMVFEERSQPKNISATYFRNHFNQINFSNGLIFFG